MADGHSLQPKPPKKPPEISVPSSFRTIPSARKSGFTPRSAAAATFPSPRAVGPIGAKLKRERLLPSIAPNSSIAALSETPRAKQGEQLSQNLPNEDVQSWTTLTVLNIIRDMTSSDSDVEFAFHGLDGRKLLQLTRFDILKKFRGNEDYTNKLLQIVRPRPFTRNTDLSKWTPEYVVQYIDDLGLGKFAPHFENVDGWQLASLSAVDMNPMLGGDNMLATELMCDIRKLLRIHNNIVYQSYTTEDIRRVLKDLGLKEYCNAFEFIDGKKFLSMTVDLLLDRLGSKERFDLLHAKIYSTITGMKNVFDWSKEEVRDYLVEIGLGEYTEAFRQIDGRLLSNMPYDLVKRRFKQDIRKAEFLTRNVQRLKDSIDNIYHWDSRQVKHFLQTCGMGQLTSNFFFVTGRCLAEMPFDHLLRRCNGNENAAKSIMRGVWRCLPPAQNLYSFTSQDLSDMLAEIDLAEYKESFNSLNGWSLVNITRPQLLERVNARAQVADRILAKLQTLKTGRSNVYDWNEEDICFFLFENGCGNYIPLLRGMCGADFADLDRDDLKEFMALNALGQLRHASVTQEMIDKALWELPQSAYRDLYRLLDLQATLTCDALGHSEAHRLKLKIVETKNRHRDEEISRISREITSCIQLESEIRGHLLQHEEEARSSIQQQRSHGTLALERELLKFEVQRGVQFQEQSVRLRLEAEEQQGRYALLKAHVKEETGILRSTLTEAQQQGPSNLLRLSEHAALLDRGDDDDPPPQISCMSGCPFLRHSDCPLHSKKFILDHRVKSRKVDKLSLPDLMDTSRSILR